MLYVEAMVLCLVFWLTCFLGTGTDVKNARSLSSYQSEAQDAVHGRPEITDNAGKKTSPVLSFLSSLPVFSVVLFLAGLPVKQAGFTGNFLNVLFLGQALNLFDLLVIDLLWWRHSKRIRFTGTKNNPELYRNPRKHLAAFARGTLLFTLVAVLDGWLLSLL